VVNIVLGGSFDVYLKRMIQLRSFLLFIIVEVDARKVIKSPTRCWSDGNVEKNAAHLYESFWFLLKALCASVAK
jgi:hypothetical protein